MRLHRKKRLDRGKGLGEKERTEGLWTRWPRRGQDTGKWEAKRDTGLQAGSSRESTFRPRLFLGVVVWFWFLFYFVFVLSKSDFQSWREWNTLVILALMRMRQEDHFEFRAIHTTKSVHGQSQK